MELALYIRALARQLQTRQHYLARTVAKQKKRRSRTQAGHNIFRAYELELLKSHARSLGKDIR